MVQLKNVPRNKKAPSQAFFCWPEKRGRRFFLNKKILLLLIEGSAGLDNVMAGHIFFNVKMLQ
jgi:hypothetical protein